MPRVFILGGSCRDVRLDHVDRGWVNAIFQMFRLSCSVGDVPGFVDESIGGNQHGDQDVLNNLTEIRSSDRTGHTD